MALDDFQISAISTVIILIVALPVLTSRIIGSPLTNNLTFEASIIYLPLYALSLLSLYQRSSYILTLRIAAIMLIITVTALITRLIGYPLIHDLSFEISITYFPTLLLSLLGVQQWREHALLEPKSP